MGIFDKLFGARKVYSPLEPTNPINKYLDRIREPLKDLADVTKDSLEVVPAGETTYVFIGKPPKQFGVAWVQNGEVYNLKSLAVKKGLSATKLKKASNELSKAYIRSEKDTRYSTKIDDCSFVVASSKTLGQDIDHIIQTVSS